MGSLGIPDPRSPPLADATDPSVGYVRHDAKGAAHVDLLVDGAHCAACIQRIENGVRALGGVKTARLNLTTRRLHVTWHGADAIPGDVIAEVTRLGYRAAPHRRHGSVAGQGRRIPLFAAFARGCGICGRQRHVAVGRRLGRRVLRHGRLDAGADALGVSGR